MKRIISLAALILGASVSVNGLLSTAAHAAPVESDVEISVEVPPVVFLQTYDSITFNLDVADLTTATVTNDGVLDDATVGTVAAGATTVTPALPPVTSTVVNGGNKVYSNVLLYRTWGLGGVAGNISHDAVVDNDTLDLGTSSITLSLAKNASTPASPTSAPGISGTGAIEGSVDFTFDLNAVRASGLHTGGVVRVSAEGV
ncbi:hypothetical protein [Calothrix sp. UHCC 0171]|uniref:hypothetical protein n=1 Tax=Calothrix sp. UHCC 0171 TaxID=3110245 RepID=UPI002B211276|nr:hypothetical protein [Calothrix sp. UHCC 0171]MEA5573896.1 hypothetical protein [Calothrix sp. UHCC 0171]